MNNFRNNTETTAAGCLRIAKQCHSLDLLKSCFNLQQVVKPVKFFIRSPKSNKYYSIPMLDMEPGTLNGHWTNPSDYISVIHGCSDMVVEDEFAVNIILCRDYDRLRKLFKLLVRIEYGDQHINKGE